MNRPLEIGAAPAPGRGIYCNRTLNLRSIRAIGYDMDYTLVHYRVEEWERRAYEHIKAHLLERGWPVEELEFQPDRFVRGLIIDTETGNIVKANRFGYVKRASHGTRPIEFESQRRLYSRTMIDLNESRYQFLNTLFSLSESCIYAQLVDLLDERALPEVLGYEDLYRLVRQTLDETHMAGLLKAEIIANPERFVDPDPELPLTLLDQRHAGKKTILITNSEWPYTNAMMSYAFDRFLPGGTWKDLFDVIIASSRKPGFFASEAPLYEVVNDEGLLRPAIHGVREDGVYVGGHAGIVEEFLGVSGDEILYVGDHIFSDVKVSKTLFRWRTALVLRELEDEIAAVAAFDADQRVLSDLMAKKERLELEQSHVRLAVQRKRGRYGPQPDGSIRTLESRLQALRKKIMTLDETIAGLAAAAGGIGNAHWGPLMRAGNDKSHLARQIERNADIYTSRVTNFLAHTPFLYLRSPRGSLPHDPGDGRRPDSR